MDDNLLVLRPESKFEMKISAEKQEEFQNKQLIEERNLLGHGYEKEELLSENDKIARQLGNTEMWEGLDQSNVLREKAKLKSRSVRNRTILLFQEGATERGEQRRSNGDLSEVQDKLLVLDHLLRKPFAQGEDTRLGLLNAAYEDLFKTMNAFTQKYRNSRMPIAKERVRKIRALERDLREEKQNKIAANEDMFINAGQRPEWAKCPMDFLDGKHINANINGTSSEYVLRRQREVLGVRRAKNRSDSKEMKQVKTVFKNLTFSFLQEIGTNEAAFNTQKNLIENQYNNLIEKCDAYLRRHKKPSKTEERERVKAVTDLKERSLVEMKRIMEVADIMRKKENPYMQGLTWADAYEFTCREMKTQKEAMERMDDLLQGGLKGLQTLTTIAAMRNLAEADQQKYGFLEERIVTEWTKQNMDKSAIDMLDMAKDQIVNTLKMVYNEIQDSQIPEEAQYKGNDGPVPEEKEAKEAYFKKKVDRDIRARKAYVGLRLQRHPAVKLLKCLFSMTHILDAGQEQEQTPFANEEVSAAEYFSNKIHGTGYVRFEDRLKMEFPNASLFGEDDDCLDQAYVKKMRDLIAKEELAESKDIVKNFVSKDLIGYDKKELENARNAISNDESVNRVLV